MKHLIWCFTAAFVISSCNGDKSEENTVSSEPQKEPQTQNISAMKTLYDFQVNDIDGAAFDLSSLKGKKVMLVNTASECGLTPQYEQLQELYDSLGGDTFTIVGFPANNFGAQEPGSNEEIKGFCSKNYGVTFPMMSKISVKGTDIHPLYAWLLEQERANGNQSFEVEWNFHKFLIDEHGAFVKQVSPQNAAN